MTLFGQFRDLDAPDRFLEHDIRFHQAVAATCDNPILVSIVEMISTLFRDFRRASIGRARDLKESAEEHLLIYASDPGWSYSDVRGFEPFLRPWLFFKLYWAAWALLLALAARLFWVRGREAGFGWRVDLARRRLSCQRSRSAPRPNERLTSPADIPGTAVFGFRK
jgi:hypothetical protein